MDIPEQSAVLPPDGMTPDQAYGRIAELEELARSILAAYLEVIGNSRPGDVAADIARWEQTLAGNETCATATPSQDNPRLPPDGMTPGQALERWNYADDPAGWHSQPVCECGDYLAQHSKTPPYPCQLPGINRAVCCARFRFARMGGLADE